MAKTLNQFLEGYLKVKNPDEQKFVDKHVVAKHSDRNGNGDEVFKGSKVKQIDRRKDRHGYNPGEDEKVYEELKGNQHKIDANKNGKLDAHDFKLLRKKKKVAEEAECIHEISKDTLKSYLNKRSTQTVQSNLVGQNVRSALSHDRGLKGTKPLLSPETTKELEKVGKQTLDFSTKKGKSIELARKKMGIASDYKKKIKVPANEEAEQISEISDKTKLSYVTKSTKSIPQLQGKKGQLSRAYYNWHSSDEEKGKADKEIPALDKKIANRKQGIERAGKLLAKEEAEQIDELSKKTLASYIGKAATSAANKASEHGRKSAERDEMDRMMNRHMRFSDKDKVHDIMKTGYRSVEEPREKVGKRIQGIKRATSRLAKEEAEQIDELSRDTLRRYRMKAKSIGDNEKGDIGYRAKGRDLAARKTHGGQWGIPKAKVMAKEEIDDGLEAELKAQRQTKKSLEKAKEQRKAFAKEEAEQIDEISAATKDSYAKKAVKQLPGLFNKSGKDADAARKYYNRKNTVRKIANEEVEQVDEVLTAKTPMGTYIKDFQKSDAPQFKGKSEKKRRVMAIAAKLSAERGGKPLRKEEKLADLLDDLSESHRRTMLTVFEKLNESNQKKFLKACETPEGVEYMLDFAINHRGE